MKINVTLEPCNIMEMVLNEKKARKVESALVEFMQEDLVILVKRDKLGMPYLDFQKK